MEFKNYEPILFEFWQNDFEKIMYQLNEAIEGRVDVEQLKRIRDDFQHKIDIHHERGEWI